MYNRSKAVATKYTSTPQKALLTLTTDLHCAKIKVMKGEGECAEINTM